MDAANSWLRLVLLVPVEIWAQDSVSFNILDGGRKLNGPWIFFIISGLRGLIDLAC